MCMFLYARLPFMMSRLIKSRYRFLNGSRFPYTRRQKMNEMTYIQFFIQIHDEMLVPNLKRIFRYYQKIISIIIGVRRWYFFVGPSCHLKFWNSSKLFLSTVAWQTFKSLLKFRNLIFSRILPFVSLVICMDSKGYLKYCISIFSRRKRKREPISYYPDKAVS